jgi:hypothetical protein
MSEILKQNEHNSSENLVTPKQTPTLIETGESEAEKLDLKEELIQLALRNADILKVKSACKEKFKELEDKLVSSDEGYPNKKSPAVIDAWKLIHKASGILIADQIINGSAPKIDEIIKTSRSDNMRAEWPSTLVKSFIDKRDFLESRRQEVTEQMASFNNDHPEITPDDFEAAVLERTENEYANCRYANYYYYGFGIEDLFGNSQGINIDYLRKITEEDNTEGTVNYRLTHD